MEYPGLPPLLDLGEYEVVRRFGFRMSGASSLLRHCSTGAPCLAKFVPRSGLSDGWLAKLSISGSFTHQCMPKVLGVGDHDDFLVVLREWIDGESLDAFLSGGGEFLPEDCLQLAATVCDALHASHQAGIAHGRLNPANLILSPSGKTWLTESQVPFPGIGELSVTRSGFRIAAPHFVSPEHFEPGALIDARSDIFSLGIVLYRLVACSLPFTGDTASEVKHCILELQPKAPHHIVSSVSPSLSNLILRMLEKSADRRYQSAEELLRDLEEIRRGRTLSASVVTAVAPEKPVVRHRSTLVLRIGIPVGAVCLVAAAILAVSLLNSVTLDQLAVVPGPEHPTAGRAGTTDIVPSIDNPARELQRALKTAEQSPEAGLTALDEVIRRYPGTDACTGALEAKAALATKLKVSLSNEVAELKKAAEQLVGKRRYGEAIARYTRFIESHPNDRDLTDRLQLARIAISDAAARHYEEQRTAAADLVRKGRFAEAASIYEQIRDSFGVDACVKGAERELVLLKALVGSEKERRTAKESDKEHQQFLALVAPAEQMAIAWRFTDAAVECDKLAASLQGNLATLVRQRGLDYERLERLKRLMIERLNGAKPPTPLASLIGKGAGSITAADAAGITVESGEASARRTWPSLEYPLVEALAGLARRKGNAEDHAAAGLLFHLYGKAEQAGRELEAARALGLTVQLPLGATAIAPGEEVDEAAAHALLDLAASHMQAKRWPEAFYCVEKLRRDYVVTTYAARSKAPQIEQWAGQCREGLTRERFTSRLKMGQPLNLMGDTVDSQWAVSGGVWSLTDGILRGQNGEARDVERTLKIEHPAQYVLSARVRVLSGSGLLIKVVSGGGTSYDFMLDAGDADSCGLWVSQAGKVRSIERKAVAVQREKWYAFSAAVRPHAITIRCGEARLSVPNAMLNVGSCSLGFAVRQGAAAEFADVVLEGLKLQ